MPAMSGPRSLIAATVLAMLLAAGACSGDDTTTSTTTIVTSSTASVGSSTKVDANEASIDDLATAFEAAGVLNAERWAREVDEYRPYSGTDDWAKLKQELSKYNIDDATLAKILSVLEV
jgi:hypothetical protein